MAAATTELDHLRAATWECPFCEETKKKIFHKQNADQGIITSLYTHVQRTKDEAHGQRYGVPERWEEMERQEYLTIKAVQAPDVESEN